MNKRRSKKQQIAKSKSIPATQQQTHQQLMVAQRQEFFQGALPHPEHLARYDEILPGLADRIVRLTENEQAAALAAVEDDQQFRRNVLQATINENKRKHAVALVALVLCLATALGLAYLDAPVAAAAVAGTTVVGVVASFLGTQWRKRKAGDGE